MLVSYCTLLLLIHFSICAACLGLQCLPPDDWHCLHCRDKLCSGRKASGESRHIILRLKRVVKAPEFEPGGCVICRSVGALEVLSLTLCYFAFPFLLYFEYEFFAYIFF